MFDGLFYYFTGTGVVVGVEMEECIQDDMDECIVWDDEEDK